MDTILQDLRYAFRMFVRSRRLTVAAVACITVGIASAVFITTLADSIILQHVPWPNADRLVRVWTMQEGAGRRGDLSYLDARDIQAQASAFDAFEFVARTRIAIRTDGGSERVRGESVTEGYFALIGARPALGRLFTSAEYAPGGPPVVLLSDALWRRRFGGRPDVVGQTVRMRGNTGNDGERLFTIVGVMPPAFEGTVDQDISEFWLPIEQYMPRMLLDSRTARMVWAVARLRPDATLGTAQQEVAAIGRRLAAADPQAYDRLSMNVEPVGETWRERFRAGLAMLSAAALLLLLIACANVANLLLARLAQRERELSLRMVLGAARGRVLRQLATESVVLAVVGGTLGTLIAVWGVRMLVARDLFQLPAYVRIAPSLGTLLAAGSLVLLTSLLFGVGPALLGARADAGSRLREGGRNSTLGHRQRRVSNALVVAEVALSFLLLVGSALMLRTYMNLTTTDVGWRTENVARFAITLDPAEYSTPERQLAFTAESKAAIMALPDVRAVTTMMGVLPPWFDVNVAVLLEGEETPALAAVQHHAVDTDFFRVLDVPIRFGRGVESGDQAGSERVAVISESLARVIAGNPADAVGRMLHTRRTQAEEEPRRIVGVTEDVQYHGPLSLRPIDYDIYVPMTQDADETISIAVIANGDPAALIDDVQRALGQLAPTSPQHWVGTMEGELGLQYGDARFYAWLTGVFGASALALALLGIYGVLTNAVSRRFIEIGVRMAVGARQADIVRMILMQGARTVGIGLAIGVPIALAAGRLVASLVYDVRPADPLTFGLVAGGLFAFGLIAAWLPARRASQVDPATLLTRG